MHFGVHESYVYVAPGCTHSLQAITGLFTAWCFHRICSVRGMPSLKTAEDTALKMVKRDLWSILFHVEPPSRKKMFLPNIMQ